MRRALAASLLLAACGPEASAPSHEVSRTRIFPRASPTHAVLHGPTESLTFWAEEAHLDPALFPAGQSCSQNGRWILRLVKTMGDYETLGLYVEALEQNGSWTPVGLGLQLVSCTGGNWLQEVEGTLVIDSSTEGRVRLRADLRGELWGEGRAFVGDFGIRPGEGCAELEHDLGFFGLR